MADSGHFTLEAAVALAIAGSLIATGQLLARNATLRLERTRQVYDEVVALEYALNCTPRIMVRGDAERVRAECRLEEKKAPEGALRAYTFTYKREVGAPPFPHLLAIELER